MSNRLKILVVGGSGLIGSAVAARLAGDGHEILSASRHPFRSELFSQRSITIDISEATASDWIRHLSGVDAVVNCAGILQSAPGESTQGVHQRGLRVLLDACQAVGVKKIIHFSAVGVDRRKTEFSRTKHSGDQAVIKSPLEWVILRPSVVIGRSAYGGSALIRGLASLPVLPVLPNTGRLQLVHLDDVVQTVVECLKPTFETRQVIDLVGPRSWSLNDAVALVRSWLTWRRAYKIRIPDNVGSLMYKLGDAASVLGWRPPIRSTARREIVYGATGDSETWQRATGIKPRDIAEALAKEPASVQERWFAKLYLLKPLIFAIFSLFWIVTGLISLGPGWEIGMSLMREGGVTESIGRLAVLSGALADVEIGMAILYRPTSKYGLYAGLIISITYAIIGTVLVPRLWSDPLGPMLKIWPVMMLNVIALAILEDR